MTVLVVAADPSDLDRVSTAPARGESSAFVRPTFEQVYAEHFDFVWRCVRRLGVAPASSDDAVQDVFLVVHRRLADFEGRSSVRTWLFGIARRVVRDHRPRARERELDDGQLAALAESADRAPDERAARNEAARLLNALLQRLDEDKREAFILSELEQISVPDIADEIGVNLNTVYSRVRAARKELEEGLARLRAQQSWRQR